MKFGGWLLVKGGVQYDSFTDVNIPAIDPLQYFISSDLNIF
jgi:hypothetical protein